MNPSAQRLYTPTEVAAELRISRTATYALMASGRLASVTIGRSRRVTAEALDAFVADLCATNA